MGEANVRAFVIERDSRRERGKGGKRLKPAQTHRENENSNTETFFSKDCSSGSFRPV